MILLRQAIDGILKEKGLDYLHLVRTKDGNPGLAGKCGKIYYRFYEIEMPKKLTAKEREYIAKLIGDYIDKNLKEIKEVIKIISNPLEFKEPDKFTCSTVYGGKVKVTHYFDKDSDVTILLHLPTKKIYKCDITTDKTKYLKKIPEIYKETEKVAKEYADFIIKKREQEKKLQKLQSCSL